MKSELRDLAELKLQYREFRSPISGLVVEMLKDVGEAVAPNETIVRVVNLDRLRVVSRIDQAVIGSVKIGDEIIFLPIRQNAEVDSISAVITFISPEFIAEEGVVEIWAEFDNRESRMFAGEAGEIEIPSLRNK